MYSLDFYTDSWIELSSQPSSSSLSSAGDNDIITAGLQIQHEASPHRQRFRRLHAASAGVLHIPPRPTSAGGSSQEEYEESESESDRAMSSSNEDILSKEQDLLGPPPASVNAEEEEDDTSTALGTCTTLTSAHEAVFTPQPNAFSHPPSQTARSTSRSTPVPDSYFSTPPATTLSAPSSIQRPATRATPMRNTHISSPRVSDVPRTQPIQSHSPYNILAPSHNFQPDHDAALRASLSTLLSCAAAIRGSPKETSPTALRSGMNRQKRNAVEPSAFRLVPQSHLWGSEHENAPPVPARKAGPSTSTSSANISFSSHVPKQAANGKRKARESSKDRHAKKSPNATKSAPNIEEAAISPTLMSWMISAGVVLVFSAISFSAGYAWGKEVGRFEATMGIGADGASCGKDAIRGGGGFRRLRWGTGSTSIRA